MEGVNIWGAVTGVVIAVFCITLTTYAYKVKQRKKAT